MKRSHTLAMGFGLLISTVGSTAMAQDLPWLRHGSENARNHLVTPIGASVTVGGGVSNFFRESVRDLTGVSGTWDARLSVGTRYIVGGELAYIGGARSISAPGMSTDANLINNGGEATLRLNAPFEVSDFLLSPFVFGGVGFSHYYLRNTDPVANTVAKDDDIGTLPVGIGFSFGYKGLVADARATYRPTFDDGELVKAGSTDNDLQSWAAGITVGYEF
ncbi:MAG TPA: hypothetical protein VGF45_15800 [Polyangia bacterium]